MDIALKEISTRSRFHEAAGAIMQLARQIVGERTFFVSHIDADNLSILRVLNAGELVLTECETALEDAY